MGSKLVTLAIAIISNLGAIKDLAIVVKRGLKGKCKSLGGILGLTKDKSCDVDD